MNIKITALDEGAIITIDGKKVGCGDLNEQMEKIVIEAIKTKLNLRSLYFQHIESIDVEIKTNVTKKNP